MDIERLSALVQSWREIAEKHDARAERLNESGDASDAAWCEAAAEHRSYCADELATLIAELGQEVGAVGYDDGTGRVRDWASPAHTSEARDAALVDELVQASLALQMAKALTSLPLKNEFAKRNGMASHYEVEAWMLNAHRRFDAALAAMRQEVGGNG